MYDMHLVSTIAMAGPPPPAPSPQPQKTNPNLVSRHCSVYQQQHVAQGQPKPPSRRPQHALTCSDSIPLSDTDELFQYIKQDGRGHHQSIQEVTRALEEENATYALGEMLYHLAPTGKLETVHTTPR